MSETKIRNGGYCNSCPFAWWTEASTNASNWGCLPSPFEIMELKRNQDLNWTCHGDKTVLCVGFVITCKEEKLDSKSGKNIEYEKWYRGEDL
jgi:hypothetical protein